MIINFLIIIQEDMTEKEIKITFAEAKLEALIFFLKEQNEKNVEELLKSSLDKLYEKNVPMAVRKFVERDEEAESLQETISIEQETQSERVARQPRTPGRRSRTVQSQEETPQQPTPETSEETAENTMGMGM